MAVMLGGGNSGGIISKGKTFPFKKQHLFDFLWNVQVNEICAKHSKMVSQRDLTRQESKILKCCQAGRKGNSCTSVDIIQTRELWASVCKVLAIHCFVVLFISIWRRQDQRTVRMWLIEQFGDTSLKSYIQLSNPHQNKTKKNPKTLFIFWERKIF